MDIASKKWKFLLPAVPLATIHRKHLLHILGEALSSHNADGIPNPNRLVLLCAPAGYGKTTLLADVMKHRSLTSCWYFLDRSDLDALTFLAMFLASIRLHFPSFGSQLDTLLASSSEQDNPGYQPFLNALIHALATDLSERCILALCNYQEVNGSAAITDILNQLLSQLPSQCLIVIESRAVPNFELAPLIINRKVFGLGGTHLQFSAQDVYDLAQLQGLTDFSEEEATQVATTFQGWITGILLGSRLGSAQFKPFIPANNDTWLTPTVIFNQQLSLFVIKDIFRTEPAIYDFLKNTSLLEHLTSTFCDAFLGTSNAATMLEYAVHQGLFVVHTGAAEEPVYRCHPTLQALFREELRRHEPEKYRTFHHQLATLFLQKYAYETALSHALEAQHYDLAAQILLDNASILFNRGQSETILLSLERFPFPFLQAHPRLLLLHATLFLRRGDFASARRLLESLQDLVTPPVQTDENTAETLTYAEFAIASGRLLLYQGAYQQAQHRLQQALDLLPIDEHVLRITTHQHLGICLILRGEPVHEGIIQFQQALRLCHPQRDERLAGEIHHQLANAYAWTGNYTLAEHHRQRIRTIQDRLGQPKSVINNLIGMGILKMRQGLVEESETYFQAILHSTELPRSLSSKAYALLGIGELALTRQHWQEAFAHLEEALSLARQLEDHYLLNSVLYVLATTYLRVGETHTAQCLLDQATIFPEEKQSYGGIFHQLVQGTLFLAQQRYDQAKTLLEETAHLTEKREFQWLRIQALMRLAACYLEQGQRGQASAVLHQVRALNIKGNYDYGVQVELQIYSGLQSLMQEPVGQEEPINSNLHLQNRLTISALGEPLVLIDTLPVTHWRMARAMELFFYLLERNQPLRKDQIITALWPEADDINKTNQTFRSTIHHVRQAIGENCLIHQSGRYRLDLTGVYGPFLYDVAVFEEQQQIAKKALEADDDDCAAKAFQIMVDLYRGDYVQAFYTDWCIKRRDELREAFLEVYRQLALIAWRREEWDESLHHWQHLLTFDPCMERAHQGIIRCYLRQGRRDLALRQYQRCSQELHEQLNTKPGPALQKLYQRIVAGEV